MSADKDLKRKREVVKKGGVNRIECRLNLSHLHPFNRQSAAQTRSDKKERNT